jgi:uncharacterized membrane protein YgcG
MQIEPAPNGVAPEFGFVNLGATLNRAVPRSCASSGRLVRRQLAYLVGGFVPAKEPRRESLCSSFPTSLLAGGTFEIFRSPPDCTELGPWRAQARELQRWADRVVRGRSASSGRCHSRRLDARPRAPRRRVPASRQRQSGVGGGGGSSGDGSSSSGPSGDDDGSSGDPDDLDQPWPTEAAVHLGGRRGW